MYYTRQSRKSCICSPIYVKVVPTHTHTHIPYHDCAKEFTYHKETLIRDNVCTGIYIYTSAKYSHPTFIARIRRRWRFSHFPRTSRFLEYWLLSNYTYAFYIWFCVYTRIIIYDICNSRVIRIFLDIPERQWQFIALCSALDRKRIFAQASQQPKNKLFCRYSFDRICSASLPIYTFLFEFWNIDYIRQMRRMNLWLLVLWWWWWWVSGG